MQSSLRIWNKALQYRQSLLSIQFIKIPPTFSNRPFLKTTIRYSHSLYLDVEGECDAVMAKDKKEKLSFQLKTPKGTKDCTVYVQASFPPLAANAKTRGG